MPALNFQKQFAYAVESGTKRQTIRAERKDGRDPKPGDTLYLFTGMRTKQCRRLGEEACKSRFSVWLSPAGSVWLDGTRLDPGDCESLAIDDGFEGDHNATPFEKMIAWFKKTHSLPFSGYLIKW